ncbi:hypothetical protein [Gloeobacter morelensis]|uniref:PLL-like beta propeller domain-containing protein n=1 Tax=Gloeobacter morelensis MG652769 TaxID=2781736 RepID=A0ABY3PH60_9CYAN|nr:hypothetical protein [Gloeobacter morelensis]UFP92984.1 hypothetical protein ISF26_14295 [Gloeobacter morelensis MG652769]
MPAVEDFDADGIAERMIFRGGTGDWFAIYSSLLFNSGRVIRVPSSGNLHTVLPTGSGTLAWTYRSSSSTAAWSPPAYFGSGVTGNPALIRLAYDSSLRAVYRNTSGGLTEYKLPAGGSGWQKVADFGSGIVGNPSLVETVGGNMWVVAPNSSGGLSAYSKVYNTSWGLFSNFGSNVFGTPALIRLAFDGSLQVVVPNGDGLAHYQLPPYGSWQKIADFGSGVLSNPTLLETVNGNMWALVGNSSGGLTAFSRVYGTTWGATSFGSGLTGTPAFAKRTSDGALEAIAIKQTGGLVEYRLLPGGTAWTKQADFATSVTGNPLLIDTTGGNLSVIAPGVSGGLAHYGRGASTGWSGAVASASMPGRGASLGAFPAAGFVGRPIPADYDGDGRADRAAFGASSYTYQIKQSSDGATRTYGPFFTSSGGTMVFELPGDYDGDGKVDPAAVNASTYSGCPFSPDGLYTNFDIVFRSSANGGTNLQTSVVAYGGPPINNYLFPAVGDFDGDGKSDPAYFFPAFNVTYYVSSLNQTVVESGPGCGYGYDTVNNFTNAGINFSISPILIDTKGDGFALTSADGGVLFDLQGRGGIAKNAWTETGSDDAFLVLDRDENGTIDDGRELFGNHTAQPASVNPNGFLALAEFDKPAHGGNGDGAISAEDTVFSLLLLWTDRNHNGISEPEELKPYSDSGPTAISLTMWPTKVADAHGNWFRWVSRLEGAAALGMGSKVVDVIFATEKRPDARPLPTGTKGEPRTGETPTGTTDDIYCF